MKGQCRKCGLGVLPAQSFHHRGRAVVHQHCPDDVADAAAVGSELHDILEAMTFDQFEAAIRTVRATLTQPIPAGVFAGQVLALAHGDQTETEKGTLRVNRRKGSVGRAQEAARMKVVQAAMAPECCDEPSPRIAARSGRLYCSNCETYISIDRSALSGGTIHPLPPHEDD